ncbi:hypothetical protein VTJ83DRAFT_4868 [Remersonia thermophila]|uniref:NACHT domain-containing protein n=1 Tax=Remersonia thermophila TaxID=72144 RepID=A0ABR4DCN6_9PEZI
MEAAFRAAKQDFLDGLTETAKATSDFSQLATIDDVVTAARDIQKKQREARSLRVLARVQPLLRVLQEYTAVLDTFAQIQPEILCLIWGPIRFLLQTTSNLTAAFDKVVNTLQDASQALPRFQQYAALFPDNVEIRRVLCLFFEDLLSLYAELLNFVTDRRLSIILEPFWPRIRSRIEQIQSNMRDHTALIKETVTLEDVSRAQRARKAIMEEAERNERFRRQQNFSTIRNDLHPETYHLRLEGLLSHTVEGSGRWLDGQDDFMDWLDPVDRTVRCLWVHGIPGAGQTHLAAHVIDRLRKAGLCVLFAFITHEHEQQLQQFGQGGSIGLGMSILHSLLFQALDHSPDLRQMLPEPWSSGHTKLSKDVGSTKHLLCTILKAIGPSFIILDGLDEIEEEAWRALLSTALEIRQECVETKLLISSRELCGIASMLEAHAVAVRVDKGNFEDIRNFVRAESDGLLAELARCPATEQELSDIRPTLESIATKADGMFLYARLAMYIVKDCRTIPEIRDEVNNLPDGLDQAYGRVISAIERKMSPKLRAVARQTLMWIACARRMLREEELLQALVVDICKGDFTRGRKDYRDIREACGPIIEVVNGVVRFAHFSVKSYIVHEQSNRYLSLEEAHLNAMLTCASYLSFSSLDVLFSPDSEDADIERRILNGDFVLLDYAVSYMFTHIAAWSFFRAPESSVSKAVDVSNRLVAVREIQPSDYPAPPASILVQFEAFFSHPSLHWHLASATDYMCRSTRLLPELDDIPDGDPNHPLPLFSAYSKFRQHLEKMFCDSQTHKSQNSPCNCRLLEKLYGPRRYYCSKAGCPLFYYGFRTREIRDRHVRNHKIRRRIPILLDHLALHEHRFKNGLSWYMMTAHGTLEFAHTSADDFVRLSKFITDDAAAVFKDVIAADVLAKVRRAMPQNQQGLSNGFNNELVKRVCPHCSARSETQALHVAIETESLPNIELLLSRNVDIMAPANLPKPFAYVKSCRENPRILGLLRALRCWNAGLMRLVVEDCGVQLPTKWPAHPGVFWDPGLIFAPRSSLGWDGEGFGAASVDDLRARFNDAVKPYLARWPEALRSGACFAVSTGSPALVRVCLEAGGDPNGRPAQFPFNPLYEAVQPGNPEMVDLLLQFGADPEPRVEYRPKEMEKLAGMKKVEEYFGMPWKKIVERVREGKSVMPASSPSLLFSFVFCIFDYVALYFFFPFLFSYII